MGDRTWTGQDRWHDRTGDRTGQDRWHDRKGDRKGQDMMTRLEQGLGQDWDKPKEKKKEGLTESGQARGWNPEMDFPQFFTMKTCGILVSGQRHLFKAHWWSGSIDSTKETILVRNKHCGKNHDFKGRIYGTGMPVPLHVLVLQPCPNDPTCQFQMNMKFWWCGLWCLGNIFQSEPQSNLMFKWSRL